MHKRWLIFALTITILQSNYAFAGTGQIFSPSGLPQSSTQSYTPPTPGNTPTVTFPTPPLPLGEGVLQGFPGASVPLANTKQQSAGGNQTTVLSPDGKTQGQSVPIPTNDVQSFFQCPPATTPTQQKTKSPLNGPAKLMWHVLDNLGIPMFVGKDNDLDPSLSQPYVMPSQKKSTRIIIPAAPQKIPQSELEGTDVSPQQNNQPVPLH